VWTGRRSDGLTKLVVSLAAGRNSAAVSLPDTVLMSVSVGVKTSREGNNRNCGAL
jgi:hypothetical protein